METVSCEDPAADESRADTQRLRGSCMTEVMTAGPEVARIEQVTRKELVYIKGESEFEVYK